MSGQGRGRGQSKNVERVDKADERVEIDRQQQLEAARSAGIPESEVSVRGRGGFRQTELRTIPSTATDLRNKNITSARSVDILANFVMITPMQNRLFQMYRVDVEPKVESESILRRVVRAAGASVFDKQPLFDGMSECRSGQRLPNKVTEVPVALAQEDDKDFKVKFTHTGDVPFGSESLKIYNMHMKDFLRYCGYYSPQLGLFVNPEFSSLCGNEIRIVRGWRTSACTSEGNRMLMNLEGAHKLMQEDNVLQYMTRIRERSRASDLQESLRTALIGKIVVTAYNKRVYKIEDVDFTTRPTHTFDRKGEQISFIDFYRRFHNKNIVDRNQPLLKCMPNKSRRGGGDEAERTVLIIPELCNLAGLTERQRADNQVKMNLIRATQIAPTVRVQHMRDFLTALHNNSEVVQQLTSWGYSYAKDGVKLKAYVIPPTKAGFGPRAQGPSDAWERANVETSDIRVEALAKIPQIKKMVIIVARTDLQDKNQILTNLKSGFDRLRLAIGNVQQVEIREGDSPAHYVSTIRGLTQDTDLAIVVMHAQNKERYDAIKKIASVERGLVTQVVTARLMLDQRKARSAAMKIAIQVAAKVGGEPWYADIRAQQTMVCGYDTHHDTTKRGRSYGAFLASINSTFSRWWSKADAHDRLEEVSSQMAANITEAVVQYKKFNNGVAPARIVMYRDGVSEGQLAHVFNVELKTIVDALGKSMGAKKPLFTMVIVNKRIGARFYMRAVEGFANPPPGTVVDHTVTRQERYDFYLVSQNTRQGTVTPTYYNIIHDEAGSPPEYHQHMAYKFCLLYYNWTGNVRVPAPCQYAHKLAFLCGEHLHNQPNAAMDNKLHFL